MGDNKVNQILIPNVTKIPKGKSDNDLRKIGDVHKDEFKNLLKEKVSKSEVQHGIKLSTHAAKRLQERNLELDGPEFLKLKGAIEKLKVKGGRDSLVITDKAAYIVDVDKNTIVTAVDKNNMAENVFTKIDSTLFMN